MQLRVTLLVTALMLLQAPVFHVIPSVDLGEHGLEKGQECEERCPDEESDGGCATQCLSCSCCPIALDALPAGEVAIQVVLTNAAPIPTLERLVEGTWPEIFQPPRRPSLA